MPPVVSIVTPVYNKEPFLRETAATVIGQSFTDWQWIIVDDASSDDGIKYLETLSDERISLHRQVERRGPAAARNTGLESATGTWVLFLDADDLLESWHLERLIEKSKESNQAGIIAGGWIEKEVDLSGAGVIQRPAGENAADPSVRDLAIGFAPWAVHAGIIRRETCPSWPESLDKMMAEDIVFWFEAVLDHSVSYVEGVGAIYRTGTSGGRSRQNDLRDWFESVTTAIEYNLRAMENRGLTPTADQCNTLQHGYSRLFAQAQRVGHAKISDDALARARHWQEMRWQAGGLGWRDWVKRIIGIPRCEWLRSRVKPDQ